MTQAGDPFDLARFVAAQAACYDTVCAELAAGQKRTHWMWFIFPQLAVLGQSPTAKRFGISGLAEARAYAQHTLLGQRLRHCAALLLGHGDHPIERILGPVDALKLRSSATLFEAQGLRDCAALLERFHTGQRCPVTLEAITEGP